MSEQVQNIPKLSETMIALLRYTKDPSIQEFTFEGVRNALGPIYSYHMKIRDIVQVLLKTYLEMSEISQFELPHRSNRFELIFQLLMSPVDRNTYKIYQGKIFNDESEIKVYDFYLEIVKKMLTDIMLVRCDWCFDQYR